MQNFQIESKRSSEPFYEAGLYRLATYDGYGIYEDVQVSDKYIEYLAEYPISEFELKEIFTILCKNVDLTSIYGYIKIRRIPHEFKATS